MFVVPIFREFAHREIEDFQPRRFLFDRSAPLDVGLEDVLVHCQ